MDIGFWLDKKVKEELMNGWKNIINLFICICKFYVIDIDLISSNYSMYGLVVGMYGSVMKYYIVVLEKRDLEIILILF